MFLFFKPELFGYLQTFLKLKKKTVLPRPSREAAHVFCHPWVVIRNNLISARFQVSGFGSLLVNSPHLFFQLPSGFCSQSWLVNLKRRIIELHMHKAWHTVLYWYDTHLCCWGFRTNIMGFPGGHICLLLSSTIQCKRMTILFVCVFDGMRLYLWSCAFVWGEAFGLWCVFDTCISFRDESTRAYSAFLFFHNLIILLGISGNWMIKEICMNLYFFKYFK